MKLFLVFLAISPHFSYSEEKSSNVVCTDPSDCAGKVSLEKFTDKNMIEQMAGLLDSVGGEAEENVVTGQNQEKEEEDMSWWVHLQSQASHLRDSFPGDLIKMYVPEWLNEWIMELSESLHNDDKMKLLGVVAITLVVMWFINMLMVRSSRDRELIAKLAGMDKKLFNANNQLMIAKRGLPSDSVSQIEFDEKVKEKEIEIVESRQALEQARAECEQTKYESGLSVQTLNDRCEELTGQLEVLRREKFEAVENARQTEEMMEEMLQENSENKDSDAQKELLKMVEKLQEQSKGHNIALGKYEKMLKQKEKEIRELGKESKKVKVDEANARLELDKVRTELKEAVEKVEVASKAEEEWKSLTDLLQSQIDEKMVTEDNLETEISSLKSRLAIFKNEAESKEEQLEELQEMVVVLEMKKDGEAAGENDGWDLGEENDMGETGDKGETREVAKLRVQIRKSEEAKNKAELEKNETEVKWKEVEEELKKLKEENELVRNAKEQAVKESEDSTRKLDVLTEFFNKKETKLQKELGIECARSGDLSTDAESANGKLQSAMCELEATQGTLKIIKKELSDQEISLKASVAAEERKAHENWVAARQAERKLVDVQGDMGVLRNRLTTVEANNHALVQRNDELQNTIDQISTTNGFSTLDNSQNGYLTNAVPNILSRSSSGVELNGSALNSETQFQDIKPDKSSLPPLPGLPGFAGALPGMATLPGLSETPSHLPALLPGLMPVTNMMLPMMDSRLPYRGHVVDGRLPPMGHISDTPRSRRNYSPEYDRVSSSTSHYRSYSPTSRMPREDGSPRRSHNKRSSPTWSERSGSPNRSYHNSGGDRRSRHRHSPTRSYHGNTHGMISRDGSPHRSRDASPQRSERGDSSRKSERESMERRMKDERNSHPYNGSFRGNGYEMPGRHMDRSQRNESDLSFVKDDCNGMGSASRARQLQDSDGPKTSSPMEHNEQFRSMI